MNENETIWLTEDHLRVLVGPRTRDVFDVVRFEGPLSASEIQERLGFASKAVYYQLKKLLEAGLVKESAEAGRAARYGPAAPAIRMPEGFQGAKYEELAARSVAAQLRKATRRFAQIAKQSPENPHLVDGLYFGTAKLRVSSAEFSEFKARLRDLLLEYSEVGNSKTDGDGIECVVVCTPDGIANR